MKITRALIGGLATIGIAAGVAALPQTAWAANGSRSHSRLTTA
jgi:hypothetical protein